MTEPNPLLLPESPAENEPEDRIFVELAAGGCGVGCKYCYIAEPSEAARPLPRETIMLRLSEITRRAGYRHGKTGPLLSIGCDTEVGVDPAVTDNAELCLAFAAEHELPVQLATKFPLPDRLVNLLNRWPSTAPVPVVFTTITTITRHLTLEPRAPAPGDRARNFGIPRAKWLSYALVKPFGPASVSDAPLLLELFKRTRPDGVVVGTQYNRGTTRLPRLDEYSEHPYIENWYSRGPTDHALSFAKELRTSDLRVFLSTRCVTAWHNASDHGLLIHDRHPHLCVGCGSCPEIPHPRSGTAH
jgi:hypothetical protein